MPRPTLGEPPQLQSMVSYSAMHEQTKAQVIALTQWSFLEIEQVLLDMLGAGRADDDGVPMFLLHQAVVRDPAQGNLRKGELMLLRDRLDEVERLEVRFIPVADATS